MGVNVLRRQKRDTFMHLNKYCNSIHNGCVSKARQLMADDKHKSVSFWLELAYWR